MSFNKDRRGHRGRGKRDDFGNFDSFEPAPYGGDSYGGGRGGFGDRDRGGFAGGDRGGGFGGGDRGGGFGGGRGGGMPAQVVGEGQGTVKFFNPSKGFGFVARDDGGEDVFVHISAVEQAGLQGLASGQPLAFTLVERNGKVSAIDLKIEGEPMPVEEFAPRQREDRPGGARGRRQLTGERTSGTVKFFNTTKGFGFIARDDGQADAFVHISAVQRAGMAGLEEGDRVAFDIEVDDRGKFAAVNLQPHQD
ncbi:cold-shock protein [Sphingopyxis alaskensis]|jgi:cold shock protein|uniref:Cold-shock DNA-binding protein family n=1 Tax=Sphingopyxis alaskensis (strain DSM 13593 / LMG 18877 / RB2256) TaxID=317655 RepID=Q1GQL9_SPHAL|nr:cold-shock protein [Sphingopyxis alaskensis]ABF54053.1 cold-shock DNA-binding protein family [Sphingopyxis alaskensis RB2256]